MTVMQGGNKWDLDGVHATPPERHSSATSVGRGGLSAAWPNTPAATALPSCACSWGAWHWQVPLLRLMQWAMMARATPLRLRPESVRHHTRLHYRRYYRSYRCRFLGRTLLAAETARTVESRTCCYIDPTQPPPYESYVCMPGPVATGTQALATLTIMAQPGARERE
jgi:hypothetical protein